MSSRSCVLEKLANEYGQGKIHMDASQIDSLILSAVGERWTKVAMAIARVERTVSPNLPWEMKIAR
jgi:hypothetical protein